MGMSVLNNAFKGYNCSLFAYGQTGSGKSYSMVGYGANKGIVPITCDAIFKEIDSKTDATHQFMVQVHGSCDDLFRLQFLPLSPIRIPYPCISCADEIKSLTLPTFLFAAFHA